jgi:hypothetical protein
MDMKDSGERKTFNSGMLRETSGNRPRFDLIFPLNQKYEDSMLYNLGVVLAKGVEKYSARNFENCNSIEELERFKEASFRHFFQFMTGEMDEDHLGALLFNLNAINYLMKKINVNIKGCKND